MLTKTELIALVNKTFPEHWQWVIENNSRSHPPKFENIPILLSVVVGEVTHEYGTEADITAHFQKQDGTKYELKGAYFENHHDSGVLFSSRAGTNWGTVEECTLNHLFGNLLYEDGGGREFEDWKRLPD